MLKPEGTEMDRMDAMKVFAHVFKWVIEGGVEVLSDMASWRRRSDHRPMPYAPVLAAVIQVARIGWLSFEEPRRDRQLSVAGDWSGRSAPSQRANLRICSSPNTTST